VFKYATKSSKQENAYKLPGKQEDLHKRVACHIVRGIYLASAPYHIDRLSLFLVTTQ